MPPSTSPRTARAAASTGKPSSPRQAAARSRARGDQGEAAALKTLSEALGARPFQPRSDNDNDPLTRSFQLVVGVVERAKATADGIQHRTYDTPLEGQVPASLSAFVTEALAVACTYYENLLNNGEEFRRVRSLKRGPTPQGAAEGAAKRVATRRRKEAAAAGGEVSAQ